MKAKQSEQYRLVFRRIGGLEKERGNTRDAGGVFRRIGGLENVVF